MAFVLVQHLDPEHEAALTQILSRVTSLPVSEIRHDQRVEPNHVLRHPARRQPDASRGGCSSSSRARGPRAPHRPIDTFFESLAQDQGERAIGVVLSGTASDGTLGLEAIKAEGGITFAQDDSAKYDSMPRSAIAAGVVDLVLSPADIADELARIARHPYGAGRPLEIARRRRRGHRGADSRRATAQDDQTALPSGGRPEGRMRPRARTSRARSRGRRRGRRAGTNGYKKILLLLRNHCGVDFSLYKSTTIQRRITRRMVLTKHDTLDDYAGFLKGNADELDALYSDVLISVTSFFRNPEAFDALQRRGPARAAQAAQRRSGALLGAGLLHRAGGVLDRHGVRRSGGEGSAHAQAPDLRHRPQRHAAGEGPPRPLRQDASPTTSRPSACAASSSRRKAATASPRRCARWWSSRGRT